MTFATFLRLCVAALCALPALATQAAPPTWAKVPNYQALYVFGDSLSDTGNDLIATGEQGFSPPVPPESIYYKGRFSNGPVAFEYLWRLVSRPGDTTVWPSRAAADASQKSAVSFAYGGSGTGGGPVVGPGGFMVYGVLGQVDMFQETLHGQPANKQALYAIWSGANDYIFYGAQDPFGVVSNLVQAIDRLYQLGARSFLVPNLPDLSLAPFVQPAQREGVSTLVQWHNAVLAQALDDLRARLPGIVITGVDVYSLTHQLQGYRTDVPALAEVAPGPAAVCLFQGVAFCPTTAVNFTLSVPFLFWDVLHPTTQVHEQVARAMYDKLAK